MEHAVIVHLRLDDSAFGSTEKREGIIELQDELAAAIDEAKAGEFDGDEFGEGECVLFMQKYVGRSIDETHSFAMGLFWAGQVPLIGCLAFALLWPEEEKVNSHVGPSP